MIWYIEEFRTEIQSRDVIAKKRARKLEELECKYPRRLQHISYHITVNIDAHIHTHKRIYMHASIVQLVTTALSLNKRAKIGETVL